MKNYVRSAIDTLVALDFQLDHEDRKLRTDRWIFTHANSPDERLILNFRMSEPAARMVVQKARVIVGLATSDSLQRKPRIKVQERVARARMLKTLEASERLAAAKREEERAERLANAVYYQRKELDRLLRGGPRPTAPSARDLDPASMLTVAEVADLTGLTDKTVQRAIDSGSLEAYMCGDRKVRVKGADVRTWMQVA